MARRFFRIDDSREDAERRLDPTEQESRPWDGGRKGRCDKCHGTGVKLHECRSCLGGESDPDCPHCRGEVRFRADCPACEGTGHITDDRREGVSVFPDEDALYRYMLDRGADLGGCVLVELEGEVAEDDDFDQDEGALLVRPARIVDIRQPRVAA